jgi:hypothetical protein
LFGSCLLAFDLEVAMAHGKAFEAVKKVRGLLQTLQPPIAFRKLHGILNALEMQVEDDNYQRYAVVRLCEAFLATRELCDIPENTASKLEDLTCKVVAIVED